MTQEILVLGIVIFLAEVVVLTIGTVRTMITVQGESAVAFWLGLLEMSLWIFGTSTAIIKVGETPFLGLCYALGFAVGNVTGIMLEKRLALGNVLVRIISMRLGAELASALRAAGFGITTLAGQGAVGPVTVQFVVCRRKDMDRVLIIAKAVDREVFYTFEPVGGVREVYSPSGNRVQSLLRRVRRLAPSMPA